MRILRWFQSVRTCGGDRGAFRTEPGEQMAHCLYTQACADQLGLEAIAQLAGIIERLYPLRASCQQCDWSSILRLIHFNNSPETTREDLDKVLAVFTEEQERDARPL